MLQQQQRLEEAMQAAFAARRNDRASKAEETRKAQEKERRAVRAEQVPASGILHPYNSDLSHCDVQSQTSVPRSLCISGVDGFSCGTSQPAQLESAALCKSRMGASSTRLAP